MAKLRLVTSKPADVVAEALVVTFSTEKDGNLGVPGTGLSSTHRKKLIDDLRTVGARGKSGEVFSLPAPPSFRAGYVVAVGIGTPDTGAPGEQLRQGIANGIRSCVGRGKVAVLPPDSSPATIENVALGARLAAYSFDTFKSESEKPTRSISVLASSSSATARSCLTRAQTIGDAVCLARDLINTPPNALAPEDLVAAARSAIADLNVRVKVWDERALRSAGCGGILGVGQGSARPPRLVRLAYTPRGASRHLALVGKGITFDTGGISIKPAAAMDEMKADMSGAAAVIGAVKAIAQLKLPVKITGWIPTAENMPSGTAQRPGDVLRTYSGKTVEVLNTDAEGRLILADALSMACEEAPDLVVDVATLTGAQRIALGMRTAGVMANDDASRTAVVDAAVSVGEDMWPMPLPGYLRESLKSNTADIANIGDRLGGMLSAGVFLAEFIPKGQAWVHLDIAGPAFNDKAPYGYTPRGGTGAAVRAFVELAHRMT